MIDAIERIYKLTVDGAQAARDLNAVMKATESLDKRMADAITSLKGFAGALAGVVTVGAVVSSIQRNIDAMDELSKAVQKVGIAAEDLQRLRFAADMSGVSAEQLDKAVRSLAVGMSDLATGTDGTSKALRAIGAKTGDDPVTVMAKIADQFEKMPDGIAKTNLAIELFGKKIGPDLIPMLNAGGKAFRDAAAEADKFGGVISGKTLQNAEAFNDNMSRVQRTIAGIMAQITAGLLPALTAISNDMAGAARTGDGFVTTGNAIGAVLTAIWTLAVRASGSMQQFGRIFAAVQDIASRPLDAIKILRALDSGIKLVEAETKLRLTVIRATVDAIKAAGAEPKEPPKTGRSPLDDAKDKADAAEKLAKKLEKQENDRMSRAAILIQIEKDQAKVDADLAEQTKRYADEAEKAAKAQKSLIDSLDPAGAAAEKFAKNLSDIDELFFSGVISAEQYDRMVAQLTGTFGKVGKDSKKAKTETQVLTEGFDQFFTTLSTGAADAEDAFKRMAQSIVAELLKIWAQKYIINTIMAFFGFTAAPAGAAATNPAGPGFESNVVPFARGGVLNRRAVFPMALAGEAGPEAIVPLRRTASGDLGVQAQQAEMNITINNYTDTSVTARRTGPSDMEIIIERAKLAVAADLKNGGNAVSRSLESAYGIGRGNGAAF